MRKIFLVLVLLTMSIEADEIYAPFTVEAKQSANLSFTSTGIVNSLLVDISSEVKKGDTLAMLDNSDLKASLDIAQTRLKYAKKEYNRQVKVKRLLEASKFDNFANKYESAKAQLTLQKAMFDKSILKAPFDGVIYERLVEVGDAVSGAMLRTILKIQSTHKRKLVIDIDQKYWRVLKIGANFRYTLDGDTQEYRGKISKIYPIANSQNRKIRAEVETSDFMVGLFGEGYIEIPKSNKEQ